MGSSFGRRSGNNAPDGSSPARAAISAQQLKLDYPTLSDGAYWINLPSAGPSKMYCILNSQYSGGGWMMAMKATTGTTFNYSSTYWTTANNLNPSDTTINNADAKFDCFNYFAAKDIMAIWPDITTNGGSIAGQSRGWTWLENSFDGGSTTTLLNFFNRTYSMNPGGSGKFIRDAKTFSGWANGIFSSQTDIRFYGFNYINNPGWGTNAKVRWGFGWNENSEGLFPSNNVSYIGSNDVSGGVGMDTNYGSYSAGDCIGCCNDTVGINRSARVEIYIR